jgi:hypothetical protein
LVNTISVWPMRPSLNSGFSSNWWIGSAMAFPVGFLSRRPPAVAERP